MSTGIIATIEAAVNAKKKLSNSFDKESAAFCDEIKASARKKKLRVFVVVYNPATGSGSSYTSETNDLDQDNPVKRSRQAHTEWETEHGINPDHERTKD